MALRQLRQGRKEPGVTLNGDQPGGTGRQECRGEAAGPGADLQDGAAGERAGSACNLAQDAGVEQEMLPQALVGADAVPAQDIRRPQPLRPRGGCR
jgi:hypothetical protein